MSFDLYYRPVPKERPAATQLPRDLKYAISQRLWRHDGTIRGETVADKGMLSYLDGLADGKVEGAAELAAAIREHDEVYLWIGDPDD